MQRDFLGSRLVAVVELATHASKPLTFKLVPAGWTAEKFMLKRDSLKRYSDARFLSATCLAARQLAGGSGLSHRLS